MSNLREVLEKIGQKRRSIAVEAGWEAVKVVIDDFTVKVAQTSDSEVIGLSLTPGEDPKFYFEPDAVVKSQLPEAPPDAWEPEIDFVAKRMRMLTDLYIEWSPFERRFYLRKSQRITSSMTGACRCKRCQARAPGPGSSRPDNVAPAVPASAGPASDASAAASDAASDASAAAPAAPARAEAAANESAPEQ